MGEMTEARLITQWQKMKLLWPRALYPAQQVEEHARAVQIVRQWSGRAALAERGEGVSDQ